MYTRLGIFTIRDMYEQFQNISKMGPLSKMMQMMPGMSEMILEGSDELGAQRIKRLQFHFPIYYMIYILLIMIIYYIIYL